MSGTSRSGGRNRKPTALKLLQHTFRKDRHGAEVTVPITWPAPPKHLSARERELWDALEVHCAAWVAPSDWVVLNGVVSLIDRLLTIQATMRATPETASPVTLRYTPTVDGPLSVEATANPLFGMELKYWTTLRGYIGMTGLSPVDRARVPKSDSAAKSANPLDRFIKKA